MPAKRSKVVLPAKLNPPQLDGELARERLFEWIDARHAAAAVWISGAPGAGKTMLVASYLHARAPAALWYRLDADDNDLGRFFANLGQAVDRLAASVLLPLFSAEHLQGPRAFARAWFRSAFAALPRPLVLVFDNLEQAQLPALGGLLAEAIDEATPGVQLLVTCRHAPLPELAAAVLRGTLVALPSAELDFTPPEAARFARALCLDEAAMATAVQRVNGWAAGLRLLSQPGAALPPDMHQSVLFDYFAGLLHDRLDAAGQRLLLAAALLPWVPADLLAGITGVRDAATRLEALCRHNLFTERVGGLPDVYRLHPLLREFLLQRGSRDIAGADRQRLQRAAALEFARRGDADAAIDLYLDAASPLEAAALLLNALESKLAAGQLDQVRAWCQRLGDGALDAAPTLRYGLARACFLREDAAAQHHYARACEAFAAQGDLAGQQLCAAGMLEWIYNTDSFIGHQRWSELLRLPLPSLPDGATPRLEQHATRLLGGRLLASFYGGDFEQVADAAIGEVLARLTPGAAENDKLSAAITLLGLLERHKRWDEAQLLAGRMEALLESPQVGPRMAILVRQQIAVDLHRQCGAFDEARRLALASRALAREQGFGVLEYEALAVLVMCALFTGDEPESRRLLAELAAIGDGANVYHQRFARQMQAWHELQNGRLANAREQAAALRTAVAHSGMPPHLRATWLLTAILVRFASGDEVAACAELEAGCADAEPGSRATLQVNLLALRAWCALRAGHREGAAQSLHEAWTLAGATRYYLLLAPMRGVLAELAAFALEADIVPSFARELIRRRQLRPASPAVQHWPWPVAVRTLGEFAIEVEGEPLRFGGKAPKKPLTLLKALIALGPKPVPEATLADALWPDEEADAAHDALNVTLYRLRKLLPSGTDAVRLHEARLSIDPELVWIDCRAFEQMALDAERSPPGPAAAAALLRRVLDLYRGHFLADEDDEAWAMPARERLRARCALFVGACGRALADAGRDDEAVDCWRRGLDIDDLNEAFYQGLMRSALRLQRASDGIAAYQRCRRTLRMQLGIAPSAATEELLRRLSDSAGC